LPAPIDFLCPLCFTGCQAASGLVGRRARCPFCHEIVEVEDIGQASSIQTDAWDVDSPKAAALATAANHAEVAVDAVDSKQPAAPNPSGSISGFKPVELSAMNETEENPFAQPVQIAAPPQRYLAPSADDVNPFAENPFTLAAAPSRNASGGDDDFVYDLSEDDEPEDGDDDDSAVTLGGGREREEGDMDMTPMVDVTFLLLIFFMVTAAFSLQRSLPMPVPEQKDEPSTQARTLDDFEQDDDYIVVRVDAFNTYTVITPDAEHEAPSKQDLLIRLRQARTGGSTGKVPSSMLVIADLEALHGRVVDALDAGTAVGMQRMQMVPMDEDAD